MPSNRTRSWRAPGRVNIIGEHIDYIGGTVLPFACNLELVVSVAEHPGLVAITSEDGPIEPFVEGVARALDEAGIPVLGCEGDVRSAIPVGAGLSSSAALAAGLALAQSGGAKPTPELLRRAEQLATGVHGGLMDQTAIIEGRSGHALLLDCATGAIDHVPIDDAIGFVVIDTGTRRRLADGRYAIRRAELEAGETRRVRHAETEQARVFAAVDAVRAGDVASLGAILIESHVSLRDDFEVSSEALDAAVENAIGHPGCRGARLVGAGFAGCVLAVVEAGAEHEVAALFEDAYVVTAVDGAGSVG